MNIGKYLIMDEDDTFRVLNRKSMSELSEALNTAHAKYMTRAIADIDYAAWYKVCDTILCSHGWNADEYDNHPRAIYRVRATPWMKTRRSTH